MQPITNYIFYKERTSASTAADMKPYINVRGDVMWLEISGTATAFSVTVEGKVNLNNDGTWFQIAGIKISDMTKVASETSSGIYQFDISGLQEVRTNITAVSGGNLNIFGRIIETGA